MTQIYERMQARIAQRMERLRCTSRRPQSQTDPERSETAKLGLIRDLCEYVMLYGAA